jgi:hypothetical protein
LDPQQPGNERDASKNRSAQTSKHLIREFAPPLSSADFGYRDQVTRKLSDQLGKKLEGHLILHGDAFCAEQPNLKAVAPSWILPFIACASARGNPNRLCLGVSTDSSDAYMLYPVPDGQGLISALRAMFVMEQLPTLGAEKVRQCMLAAGSGVPEKLQRWALETIANDLALAGRGRAELIIERLRDQITRPLPPLDNMLRGLEGIEDRASGLELYVALKRGELASSSLTSELAYRFVDGIVGERAPKPPFKAIWDLTSQSGGLLSFLKRSAPTELLRAEVDRVNSAFRGLAGGEILELADEARDLAKIYLRGSLIQGVVVRQLSRPDMLHIVNCATHLSKDLERLGTKEPTRNQLAELRENTSLLWRVYRVNQILVTKIDFVTVAHAVDPDAEPMPELGTLLKMVQSLSGSINRVLRVALNGIIEDYPFTPQNKEIALRLSR